MNAVRVAREHGKANVVFEHGERERLTVVEHTDKAAVRKICRFAGGEFDRPLAALLALSALSAALLTLSDLTALAALSALTASAASALRAVVFALAADVVAVAAELAFPLIIYLYIRHIACPAVGELHCRDAFEVGGCGVGGFFDFVGKHLADSL